MARVGQKIKLECEITGTPRPQIHFTHNGRELKVINSRTSFVFTKCFVPFVPSSLSLARKKKSLMFIDRKQCMNDRSMIYSSIFGEKFVH